MKSKMFNLNKANHVKKSAFDLSHEKKLSGKMGQLMPVFMTEIVPGDTFHIDTESMIRFAPMVAPVMHRINSYIHYFFVPNRIIWNDWERFVTKGDISLPTIEFTGNVYPGSIADLLGLPTRHNVQPSVPGQINDLPFRAFFQIWKDYYIDQNLTTADSWGSSSKIIDMNYDDFYLVSDDVPFTGINKFYRCWEKDYFTSALPWAQKGEPVSAHAQIEYRDVAEMYGTSVPTQNEHLSVVQQNVAGVNKQLLETSVNGIPLSVENIESASITVEEIRTATRLQRFLERNARAGTRYVEHLLAHWGVKSSDARLQRAEYIGGGKSPVVISEVLNHTGTAELPQGNMAGHGINIGRTNHASYNAEEHGFIIGIMSVIPEPTYQQGLPRLWSRKLNLDFYYPEFAQLGEQEVLNQELFFDHTNPTQNEGTFGYQSRYAEYKYAPSTVHGHFKDTLDFWHAGRKFENLPALNQEFIECNTNDINERIFAVTSELTENLYIQLYHKVTAIRPMPFFNDPSI